MSGTNAGSSQLAPGYRLDRYELLCPIAQGGMAAVWLARFQGKHGFEKLVAVKTILPLYADDAQFRQMFLDEATIASRIEHGNVAQILDLGEHEGTLYLVMEWVDGDSVSRLERAVAQVGGLFPQAMALRIASDALAGLHAAHELCDAEGRSLSVVHRDVSPQNVLVTPRGVVKVIDFGIAKARDRAAEETRSGVFKGKLHYMAPEQALGKGLDRRADIWAMAAVLYRLLAQRPVHDAGNRIDTLRSLTTNAPLAPLPLHVPARIAEIVLKALAFEPSDRYETAAELQIELDRAVAAESLLATPAELGAFVTRYLGDRLEVRRQSIAAAVHSLSDPNALEALAANPKAFSEGDSDGTEMRARSLGTASELRSEPTRVWTPLPREGSLTTNVASVPARALVPSARRKWWAFAALALGAAAALGAVTLRAPVPAPAPSSAPTHEPAAAAQSEPEPAPLVLEPTSSALPAPEPAPNVVSVESLPVSKAQPLAVPGKPRGVTPVAHPKPKRKVVDDGF